MVAAMVAAVVAAALAVVVVEKKRLVCLLISLETVLIQLAKNTTEMSVVDRHCPHTHNKNSETP